MAAFQRFASSCQEKKIIHQNMAVHRRMFLLNLSFSTWRDLFCPNMKELQKKSVQAARFWSIRILVKALDSWCKVRIYVSITSLFEHISPSTGGIEGVRVPKAKSS